MQIKLWNPVAVVIWMQCYRLNKKATGGEAYVKRVQKRRPSMISRAICAPLLHHFSTGDLKACCKPSPCICHIQSVQCATCSAASSQSTALTAGLEEGGQLGHKTQSFWSYGIAWCFHSKSVHVASKLLRQRHAASTHATNHSFDKTAQGTITCMISSTSKMLLSFVQDPDN